MIRELKEQNKKISRLIKANGKVTDLIYELVCNHRQIEKEYQKLKMKSNK